MEITFTYQYFKDLDVLHCKSNKTGIEFDLRGLELERALKYLGIGVVDDKEHELTVSEKVWDNLLKGLF